MDYRNRADANAKSGDNSYLTTLKLLGGYILAVSAVAGIAGVAIRCEGCSETDEKKNEVPAPIVKPVDHTPVKAMDDIKSE